MIKNDLPDGLKVPATRLLLNIEVLRMHQPGMNHKKSPHQCEGLAYKALFGINSVCCNRHRRQSCHRRHRCGQDDLLWVWLPLL